MFNTLPLPSGLEVGFYRDWRELGVHPIPLVLSTLIYIKTLVPTKPFGGAEVKEGAEGVLGWGGSLVVLEGGLWGRLRSWRRQ
jgi:hypothetical protein